MSVIDSNGVVHVCCQCPYAGVLDEVEASSGSYTDLGGPSITLDLPDGAWIRVTIDLEMHSLGHDQYGGWPAPWVAVFDSVDFPAGLANIEPAIDDIEGDWASRSNVAQGFATPGVHTYTMEYKCAATQYSSSAVSFRNRRLWIEALLAS